MPCFVQRTAWAGIAGEFRVDVNVGQYPSPVGVVWTNAPAVAERLWGAPQQRSSEVRRARRQGVPPAEKDRIETPVSASSTLASYKHHSVRTRSLTLSLTGSDMQHYHIRAF